MVVNQIGAGRIESLQTSPGGVPKQSLASVTVLPDRIQGDDHNDKVGHGGPDRAVCIYSRELIDALSAEGHPIFPGSIGENMTVSGLNWETMGPGVLVRVGEVTLEVTGYAPPCKTIRESFTDHYFVRISQKVFPGWSRVYARVLSPGEVRVGDGVVVESKA